MDDQMRPPDEKQVDEAAPSRRDAADSQPPHYDDPVDDASDDSFPASDPPSFTDSTATRNPH